MQQCLAVLLYRECSDLLEQYEEARWAASQAALWSIWSEGEKCMSTTQAETRKRASAEDAALSIPAQNAGISCGLAHRFIFSSMVRSCFALVSCSCQHSAALSVLAPRACRVTESPRHALQLGSNHTGQTQIGFSPPACRATCKEGRCHTAHKRGLPAARQALQP